MYIFKTHILSLSPHLSQRKDEHFFPCTAHPPPSCKLNGLQDDKLDEQFASAGGVPNSLLKAFTSVLEDESSDPALIAAAISAPATSELVNNTPNANPVILHKAR